MSWTTDHSAIGQVSIPSSPVMHFNTARWEVIAVGKTVCYSCSFYIVLCEVKTRQCLKFSLYSKSLYCLLWQTHTIKTTYILILVFKFFFLFVQKYILHLQNILISQYVMLVISDSPKHCCHGNPMVKKRVSANVKWVPITVTDLKRANYRKQWKN